MSNNSVTGSDSKSSKSSCNQIVSAVLFTEIERLLCSYFSEEEFRSMRSLRALRKQDEIINNLQNKIVEQSEQLLAQKSKNNVKAQTQTEKIRKSSVMLMTKPKNNENSEKEIDKNVNWILGKINENKPIIEKINKNLEGKIEELNENLKKYSVRSEKLIKELFGMNLDSSLKSSSSRSRLKVGGNSKEGMSLYNTWKLAHKYFPTEIQAKLIFRLILQEKYPS